MTRLCDNRESARSRRILRGRDSRDCRLLSGAPKYIRAVHSGPKNSPRVKETLTVLLSWIARDDPYRIRITSDESFRLRFVPDEVLMLGRLKRSRTWAEQAEELSCSIADDGCSSRQQQLRDYWPFRRIPPWVAMRHASLLSVWIAKRKKNLKLDVRWPNMDGQQGTSLLTKQDQIKSLTTC